MCPVSKGADGYGWYDHMTMPDETSYQVVIASLLETLAPEDMEWIGHAITCELCLDIKDFCTTSAWTGLPSHPSLLAPSWSSGQCYLLWKACIKKLPHQYFLHQLSLIAFALFVIKKYFSLILCLCLHILIFSTYLEYNKLQWRHGYVCFTQHWYFPQDCVQLVLKKFLRLWLWESVAE